MFSKKVDRFIKKHKEKYELIKMDDWTKAQIQEFRRKHEAMCPRCKKRRVIWPGEIFCNFCAEESDDIELAALFAENIDVDDEDDI